MSQFDETAVRRDDTGKFAEKPAAAESSVTLADTIAARPYSADDSPLQREMWRDARAEVLSRAGYVPATSVSSAMDPRRAGDTRQLAQWWANEHVTAEYAHEAGDYPQMPDDYTPAKTGGLALSGARRTHRMNYSGEGLDIRMPSATAARRFASEHGGRTFDMPVQARTSSGRTVQGWVRCTPGPEGRWDTEALNFADRESSETISEGVNAVLESRRVRTALSNAGDLQERRRTRMAERGIAHSPVQSTWIQSLGYQDATDAQEGLAVMTTKPYQTKGRTAKDGRTLSTPQSRPSRRYGYRMERETFDKLAGSSEPGRTFNELVKGRTDRFDVAQCPRCSRFHQASAAHACGPAAQPRIANDPAGSRERQRMAAQQSLPKRPRSRLAALLGRR